MKSLLVPLILGLSSSPFLIAGTVSNNFDSGAGSLRDTLVAATNGEVIDFDPSLNGDVITLTSSYLHIQGLTVTIDASSLPQGVTISGDNSERIFLIQKAGAGPTAVASNVTLRGLHLKDANAGPANAGAILASGGLLNMEDCTFTNCVAGTVGGACDLNSNVLATIKRCDFKGNQAGTQGGAIFANGAVLEISNSVLTGNVADLNGTVIGGLAGSALACLGSNTKLTNCSIVGNTDAAILNTTAASSSTCRLTNCVLWGNTAPSGSLAAQQIWNTGAVNAIVANCLIEGASSAASFNDGNKTIWAGGNLDGTLPANDPLFVDQPLAASAPSTSGNTRFFAGSPLTDAGDNFSNNSPVDRPGNPRILNGTIDMGPFEGSYVTFATLHPALDPAADDNLNGRLNFDEYALGYDPVAPTTPLNEPSLTSTGGTLFLNLRQRVNGADLTTLWQRSGDLSIWAEMIEGVHYTPNSVTSPAAGVEERVVELILTGGKQFYRQLFSSSI